jgi:Fe-S oxidoreductase
VRTLGGVTVSLALGLLVTVVALGVAGRRLFWLWRLLRSGQPALGRDLDPGPALQTEVTEVVGQRRLLAWTVPGLAHAFVFWGFLVLGLTIIEAFGALIDRSFSIPVLRGWAWIPFVEDLFAVAVLLGLVVFAILRLRQDPRRLGRSSRFYGSHLGAAWLVLFMIFNVVWTLLLYRGAQVERHHFPYPTKWAFASRAVGHLLSPLSGSDAVHVESGALLLNVAVIMGFLVIVVYSKHLHIALAAFNVAYKRRPDALGPLLPMTSGDHVIDFEDPKDDDVFGRGKVEDFTWKGLLDFSTCTECGRCQSQCPAWNTDKPLSPKLLIMGLRDHAFAKAPYVLAAEEARGGLPADVLAEAARPLVGTAEEHGVIHPDVLWSCTSCGACVQQCPVDIEHVDHIMDMRRYQVLVESQFPNELNGLFKNLESKGNPWGMNATTRNAWIAEVDFPVRVVGQDGGETIPDDVEWLLWVGCAGAFDDRAKRTIKATAELLHIAGIEYVVLGDGETCTGDPARRSGNEFLFQMLAQANVEVLNTIGAKKIVTTCPHCLNTLGREYPQLGGHYEVVHHTQLLNRLVRDGKLTPISRVDEKVVYHDPCYLGRHNKVYEPPRDLLGALPGLQLAEAPRNREQSFCCGAGGARMWMEERIGTRVNETRTTELLATGAAQVATGCPFCRVMISDGVTKAQQDGGAAGVEVTDVAQLLLKAVRASAATA